MLLVSISIIIGFLNHSSSSFLFYMMMVVEEKSWGFGTPPKSQHSQTQNSNCFFLVFVFREIERERCFLVGK